jgi:hypothetical protein
VRQIDFFINFTKQKKTNAVLTHKVFLQNFLTEAKFPVKTSQSRRVVGGNLKTMSVLKKKNVILHQYH